MITIKAPAKVNWFLEVLHKRPDGYHEIETVMQAIDLFDEISVEDQPGRLELTCNIDLGDPRDNLVFRAAELLRKAHAPQRGALITLTKHIPHGAGLGGGSSDAANALIALDRLWNLNLPTSVLREIVSRVGSDCAFFVGGGTALCTGRGEKVEQLPDITGVDLVILYPNEVCPTGPVYADLSQHLTYKRQNCYLFHDLPPEIDRVSLAALIMNRLQDSALRVSFGMRRVWNETAHEPKVLARFVSGSGSSIAFLMPERSSAVRLKDSLNARALGRAFAVKTLPRGAVWG
jgi:4-diphosphocytidyl-2-C-methyl-D-erythritol kinase